MVFKYDDMARQLVSQQLSLELELELGVDVDGADVDADVEGDREKRVCVSSSAIVTMEKS